MLPEFEGLVQWTPRPYQEAVSAAVQAGAISLQRLELSDEPSPIPTSATTSDTGGH